MTTVPDALPDWARAHGAPVGNGRLRTNAADFRVDEVLGFEPDGDGEHDWLWIEKTGANTAWVARQLARHAGIPPRDVGFCGLKDRDAVTTQAFTVRRPGRDGTDWSVFSAEGVRIRDVGRHGRKLRRGAHRGNRFRLVARFDDPGCAGDALTGRWRQIVEHGVPNYFGEQRFGHGASNVALARAVLLERRRVPREKRSFALSAARSWLFNRCLAARVASGDWDRLLPGDLANLAGSRSVFTVESVTPDLVQRCADADLHPCGTMWGQGAPRCGGEAADRELAALGDDRVLADALGAAGVDADHRPLRLMPAEAVLTVTDEAAVFEFTLPSGAFATAVLREVLSAT